MQGDDICRVCPDCGAKAFRVEKMDDAALLDASQLYQATSRKVVSFRKHDGTYVFTSKNCSPKHFLAPQRDLHAFMLMNWWGDRIGRFNKYLLWFGLFVGTISTAIVAMTGAGVFALMIFFCYALVCGMVANFIFGLAIIANVMIPQWLGPVRRYASPTLLVISTIISAIFICLPLIVLVFGGHH